uniref:non-specific serine/threonine protein kinase n=1 Tax=Kalanchoe fedtschenkoi TaxID=63787 RepID=A0A7N0UCU9_KALFE
MTLRYQMNQCARINELFMILRLCLPLLALVGAAQGDSLGSYLHHFCDGGNFTYYSDYQINLNRLVFRQFPDKGGARLFYNATQGDYPDQVHGLFLCRGDMSAADCKSCVNLASQEVLIRRCAGTRAAMIWFDGCFIRYASTPFGSTLDRKPEYYIWDAGNVSEPWSAFDLAVTNMFRDLTELATSDQRLYATAEAPVSGSLRVYGLAQCTPDISRSDCKTCLEMPIGSMFRSVQGREGGRYMNPSCNLRYDIYSFTSRGVRLSNDSGGDGSKGRQTLGIAVGISVSVALLLTLSVAYLSYSKRRRRKQIQGEKRSVVQEVTLGRSPHDEGSSRTPRKSLDLPLMNFSLISAATGHFSDENKLGEGGFGPVYKGTLPDGQDIAVKRHTRTSDQGLQEYENEVSLIANLQHRNLVKLIGCCLEGKELLLIYEYMPNKSLDLILFDPAQSIKLNWRMRFSIINGIARGILYLHEDSRLRIIHRDLKASNVLLDHDMNPKISDFGMARIFYSNQNAVNTNRVVGTYGYMAPEYAMEGLFSVKSDVYSFGVLLLEIISGRRNTGFHFSRHGVSLLSYAWTLWSESETQGLELVDPSLNPSYIPSEVLKCIHIALLCVQDDPADRPTMSSAVLMLGSENTVCLRQPSQPSFSVQRFGRKRADTAPEDISTSINDITVSSVSPR